MERTVIRKSAVRIVLNSLYWLSLGCFLWWSVEGVFLLLLGLPLGILLYNMARLLSDRVYLVLAEEGLSYSPFWKTYFWS